MKEIIIVLLIGILTIGGRYKDYIDYRTSLISENGKEGYELMNQEAGIDSELESFIYYLKYEI